MSEVFLAADAVVVGRGVAVGLNARVEPAIERLGEDSGARGRGRLLLDRLRGRREG